MSNKVRVWLMMVMMMAAMFPNSGAFDNKLNKHNEMKIYFF